MRKIKNYILIIVLFSTTFLVTGCTLDQEKISQKDKNDFSQRYYCEQDSDCSLYTHVCECLNFEYMTFREETLSENMACTKEEWENIKNIICVCVDNQCQSKNYKCKKWEPGFCEALIFSGYYYDKEKNQCKYFSGGSGCSSPYFKTIEECENACINLK